MRPGRLDRRITIQQRVVSGRASNGEEIFAWNDVVSCWAEYVPNRGQEMFKADQKRAESDAMFRMRYYPGVTAQMRVVHEGVNFDIYDVKPMYGRNAGIELMTRSGLSEG